MGAMDQGLLPHKIYPEPATCGSNSNLHAVHASQLRRAPRIERDLVDQLPTPVALRWSTTTSPLALPTEVLLHRRGDNQRGDLDCHVRDMVKSHGNLIETRWKKFSRVKRANLLSSASPGLFSMRARERLEQLGPWERDRIGHFDMP